MKYNTVTKDTEILFEDHERSPFFFGIEYDIRNLNILYAFTWTKSFVDPQPLLMYISKDGGLIGQK